MKNLKIFKNIFALIASVLMITNPVLAQLTPVQQQSVPVTNLVPNAGFESGTAQWTKTGGSWSVVTSGPNLGIGTTSVCWTPSAAGQKLRSTAFNIPGILKNQGGIASISAKIPSGLGTYKFNITDGSGVVLDSKPVKQTGSEWTTNDNFSFLYNQAVSGKVQFEVEAVAASEPMICLDDSFIGKAYNVKQAETKAVGEVFAVATPTCPTGSLIADGGAIQRAFYADLFQTIGITHGQGNGSTTFNKPDYRGRFLRGVAGGSTNDPDRASRTAMATGGNTGDNVGSVQGQAFQTHTHTQNPHKHSRDPQGRTETYYYAGTGYNDNPGGTLRSADNEIYTGDTTATNNNAQATGSTAQATANETRPVNAYVTYCVQYQPPVQVYDVGQVVDSTGTSITYNGAVCPAGTLDENGASVLRTNYPKLFNKIGTAWGNGSTNPAGVSADSGCPHASNCFNIPDKRGRFNRTVAAGSANDPDAASRTATATGGNTGNNVGSVQGHAFQTHTHTQNSHSHLLINSTYLSGAPVAANQLTSGTYIATGIYGSPYDTSYTLYPSSGNAAPNVGPSGSTVATNQNAAATGTTAQATANETRPVNVNVKSCIIYDGTIYTPVFAGAVTSKSNTNGVTVINTIVDKSADYVATTDEDVIYIRSSGGVRVVTLPDATQVPGKVYEIYNVDSTNYSTITAAGGTQVCGQTSIRLAGAGDVVRLRSTGGSWRQADTDSCNRTVSFYFNGTGTNNVCNASPCAVSNNYGGQVSLVREGTGDYGVQFSSGLYSRVDSCHFTVGNVSDFMFPFQGIQPGSVTYYDLRTTNTSSVYKDVFGSVTCKGVR